MMKNLEFLVFALLLFSGVVAGHMALQMTLSQDPALMKQIERAGQERHEADLRADLAENRLADFREQVAALLPSAIAPTDSVTGPNQNSLVDTSGAESKSASPPHVAPAVVGAASVYPLRQLASVVVEGRDLTIERASSLLEKGKSEFRSAEFDQSNHVFTELISRYPESVHLAEAHFLLAEGEFKTKDYEAAIATIEKMIALFPENELTGFALLRLGRIYEIQDRLEDASDIYKSVLVNFKQPQWQELQKQAQASLQGVRL